MVSGGFGSLHLLVCTWSFPIIKHLSVVSNWFKHIIIFFSMKILLFSIKKSKIKIFTFHFLELLIW